MRNLIIVFLIFAQSFSVLTYGLNAPTASQWVGLNKIGSWKTAQEAAYPELVRRIQTWAENIDSLNVQVVIGTPSISNKELAIDKLRSELSEASEILQSRIFKGGDEISNKKLLAAMIQIRRRASGRSELGPQIQKSLLVEAAYHWNEGNISLARTVAERAIKIHPDGQTVSFGQWDNSALSHFNVDAFDSFISQVKSKQTRNCAIQVVTVPVGAQISINGFRVTNPEAFVLASQSSHHLEVSSSGFETKKEMISCKGLETKKIRLVLNQGREVSQLSKRESIKEQDLKSMLLVEPAEDRFKLFLYTPGTALDEIPLNHPIKLVELGSQAENRNVPIATDAAINLFEKHRLLAMNLQVGDHERDNPLPTFKSETRGESREKKWIESPVFWGIVGGVILGGTITYFASQNKGPASTTSDWH
jgi:hypothetical protein